MPRPVPGSVVVVTGASSGIGRATAEAFAARGANVVLAARREGALGEAASACARHGAETLVVPTDVTDAAAVDVLGERAFQRFGRVDTWVNNAGVYAVGRLVVTPPEVIVRVLETNLLGVVNGSRAALRRFEAQAGGVLVNVASVDAHVAGPYVAAYVASKWAVLGLSESLRQEVRRTRGIHVAVVSPASIDTPLFQHAANYSGRPVEALRPTYPPEQVAEAVVRLAERPRREVVVGAAGRLAVLQRRVSPVLADRGFARLMELDQLGDGRAEPTAGNLFAPLAEGTGTTGGWETVPVRMRRRVLVAGGALAAAGAAAAALLERRR